MRSGWHAAGSAAFGILVLAIAADGRADTTVLCGSFAQRCSMAARQAADRFDWNGQSVFDCGMALETEHLTIHDRAATFVNRGTLLLSQTDYGGATSDFNSAIALEPTLGEAHTDRVAVLIAERDFAGGIAEIDQGLALKSEEPEKAYFNRAIAREHLGDIKGAYLDYRTASELKPQWEAPRQEMARFTVKVAQ